VVSAEPERRREADVWYTGAALADHRASFLWPERSVHLAPLICRSLVRAQVEEPRNTRVSRFALLTFVSKGIAVAVRTPRSVAEVAEPVTLQPEPLSRRTTRGAGCPRRGTGSRSAERRSVPPYHACHAARTADGALTEPKVETPMTNSTNVLRGVCRAAAVLALAGCGTMSSPPATSPTAARAPTVTTLTARLAGTSEVPPVNTPAVGMLTASYDAGTRTLSWTATYSGLSGPATAAHFHGPAAAGANAGIVLPFPDASSPIQASATLTEAQATDLLAGRWYVNIHTATHPGGEIRGQVAPL